MLQQLKYYARATARLIKHRKVLIAQFDELVRRQSYREPFVKAYGYWPDGLEYSGVDILQLASSARIGKNNKLIISRMPFPCGTKKSVIAIGHNCWTGNQVEINIVSGTQIIIKDYTTIQDQCKLIGSVTIEKYCLLAPCVFVSSGNHYASKGEPDIIRNQDTAHLTDELLLSNHSNPVHIEEDCWIGYSAFIKQGVYIGKGTVIGANAVVTKDVLPYSIIGGVNALINERYAFIPPAKASAAEAGQSPYFYRGFFHKREEQQEKDHKVLGAETGVVLLEKGEWQQLLLSGKILTVARGSVVELSVTYNGQYHYQVTVTPDPTGKFLLSMDRNLFYQQATGQDPVLRMTNRYNVFHIGCKVITEAVPKTTYPLLAVDYLEEKFSALK